ncbi:MAG: acyltransferase family protein [Acidobacteriota bacterium]
MNTSLSIYLDLIRLLAASLVVFGHSYNFTHGFFSTLAGHGSAAVAVFFVLSGFVIAFVTDVKEKNWRDYTISRSARIYSVAFSALAITVLADLIGYSINPTPYLGFTSPFGGFSDSYFQPNWTATDLVRMMTFTNEIWQSHIQVGSGEPYWSLGFEVWYYVIFGFFIFSPFKGAARWVPALICCAVAGPKIVLYLPLWLMGVALYRWLTKTGRRFAEATPTALLWGGLMGSPVLYLLARHFMAPLTQSMFLPVSWDVKTVYTVVYFHLVGLIFSVHLACFYGLSQQYAVIATVLTRFKRPIQWTAGATFTLYLVHQPLLLAILAANPLPKGEAAWAYSSVAAVFALVFVVAQFTERKKTFWRQVFATLLGGHTAARTT